MKTMNSLFRFASAVVMTFAMNIAGNAATISTEAAPTEASSTITASAANVKINKTDLVKGNTTDVYTMTFYKGNTYRIYVNGDGDTDLDLYIYDENDNLVDSDTDSTDYCIGKVTPKWTGTFKIKIKNQGSISNLYSFKVTYE